jgi:hypothetical protein
MRFFEVLGHILEAGGAGEPRTCARCKMRLLIPALEREGAAYCGDECASLGSIDAVDLRRSLPVEPTVEIIRAIAVERPVDEVARFLSRVELLPLYEDKLEQVKIVAMTPDGRAARIHAQSRIGSHRFQFEITFRALRTGGFMSSWAEGPLGYFSGGFSVTAHEHGAHVTHTERYVLKIDPARLVSRAWARIVSQSMERELRRLKRLVESPGAFAEALRLPMFQRIEGDAYASVWDPRIAQRSSVPAMRVLPGGA